MPPIVRDVLRLSTRSLVVLIGPSSAGKSTWAAAHFRPEQILSSDDLRALVGGSRHDQRAGDEAFRVLDQLLASRLRRRLLTVVDTLGLEPGRRREWVRAAHDHGMAAVAVRFDVDPGELRARNAALPRVPAPVHARQIRKAAAVEVDHLLEEGFDVVAPPAERVTILPPDLLPAVDPHTPPTTEPRTMRFGLQIPRFDPPAAELRDHLVEVARAAEDAGFHSLWVMDHFLQIPQVGREWEDMLEAYTTLGFLAAATQRVRLGTLVTGITYRNIAILAKQLATLDVLSGGRAIAGLGAGWFEREHQLYDVPFPPLAERYARLRDALELLPLMWGRGTPPFEGRTTAVAETICYPRPVQERIPIMVGGSGERTTLRLVARHADACNISGDLATVRRKVEVLHRHCADVGRDPAEVEITTLGSVLAAPDRATLDQRVRELTPRDRPPEKVAERYGAGTIEDQITRFRAYADAGVGTAIINLPRYDAERVRELAPLVAAFAR